MHTHNCNMFLFIGNAHKRWSISQNSYCEYKTHQKLFLLLHVPTYKYYVYIISHIYAQACNNHIERVRRYIIYLFWCIVLNICSWAQHNIQFNLIINSSMSKKKNLFFRKLYFRESMFLLAKGSNMYFSFIKFTVK